ncbi:NUDIX hydrolase [Streptomyces tropicalis]|uniref:NUDIX hydrolase n=1 Tax=Streptomyces tropicalis TaxID=3034234 RepID=A0ABT6A4B1_9ACTN|nr:NUDIX hydrolase [Streptomyces tropicalis]MDF3299484.1 NUDIX hydrolase [Streptomyces tropicalis]
MIPLSVQSTGTSPGSTAVLIVNGRGQYLLHLRDANRPICDAGTWSLVGGAPEGSESLHEAVVREIREETGLVLDEVTPYATARPGGPHATTGHVQVYVAHWDGDARALPVTEGILCAWFDVSTMDRLTMCAWAHDVIRAHWAEYGTASPAARGAVPRQPSLPRSGGARTVRQVVGAHLYLENPAGEILLGLRHPDSAFAGELWHFLAGHCEQESAVSCLVREADEEAGLLIRPEDVEFAHAVHLVDEPGGPPRMQLVFRARRWEGEPRLREPDKCLAWTWWRPDHLPEPIVPYTRAAIEGILTGRRYTEMGW